MAKQNSQSSARQIGCGCLALVMLALLIAAGCNAFLSAADDQPGSPAPTASEIVAESPTPALKDLDEDGITDRRDKDADGDGVPKARDRDDQDAFVGARRTPKPTRTVRPTPTDDNDVILGVNPGGFCGSPGAVGVASNGRTYVCRGGHWRRG